MEVRLGVWTELTDRPGVDVAVAVEVDAPSTLRKPLEVEALRDAPDEGTRDLMLAGVLGKAGPVVEAPKPPYL